MVDAADFRSLLLNRLSVRTRAHLKISLTFGLRLVEDCQLHRERDSQTQVAVGFQIFGDLESFAADGRRNKVKAMSFLEKVEPLGVIGCGLIPAVVGSVQHFACMRLKHLIGQDNTFSSHVVGEFAKPDC